MELRPSFYGFACAGDYGVPRTFTRWEDLLAAPLDAVLILTSGSHAPIAIAAAEAGKHLLIEKPMCFSVAEGRAMIGAARQAKVGEATLRRWLSADAVFQKAYRVARRAVMEGVIGRVQRVAGDAVDALERNLTCGRPGDEIRAALGVLDLATRGLEIGDLLERVEELERLAAGGADAAPEAAGHARKQSSDNGE